MPLVPPVFVMVPFETVGRIFYFAEDTQAAAPVEGRRDSPIASDAKRLPQLRPSVVAALKRAELRHTEYDVTLQRDDGTALRDWSRVVSREVAPLVNSADRELLLDAANRIDAALNSTT